MTKVYLRPLVKEDITETYLSWFKDKMVSKFLDVDGYSLNKNIVLEYIQNGKTSKSYFMYAICLKENDKHIGNLKIGPIRYKHMLSDFITVIGDKTQWHKGIATESIKLGIELAFKKYNIRKLSAKISSANIGSINAYTKAGFTIEGSLKDQLMIGNEFQDEILVGCYNHNFKSK